MTGVARTSSRYLGASALALLFALSPLAAQTAPAQPPITASHTSHPVLTQTAEMRRFVDSLLARMTLKEKIGQLTLLSSGWESTGPTLRDSYKRDIASGNVGAIFNAYTSKFTRELQTIAVEQTRLKIPLIFGYDVIHGHRTIFPIPLGLSTSWDLAAIETSALPATIRQWLATRYPDLNFCKAAKVENARSGEMTYEAEVCESSLRRIIAFTAEGKELRRPHKIRK